MKARILSLLLALCLLCCALPAVAAQRAWTVLVYICGANLESEYGQASRDIAEMVSSGVGASGDVAVLIATGGASEWQRYGISSKRVQYYRVGADGPERVKNGGDASMGDPGTLSAFLRWGLAEAPAQRCALVLWDHGGGPVYGLCGDENHGDALSLPELRKALASGLGSTKLDILAFDACMMNCVDTCALAADYARYAVASQDIVSGTGFDYDGWLKPLIANPGMPAAEVARQMAETYVRSNAGGRERDTVSMAVVDCAAMPAVRRAADAFGAALTPLVSTNRAAVMRVRSRMTSFGEFMGEDASDLVDVAALCDAYAPLLPGACAALKQAAANAVVFFDATDDFTEQASGLSLFFPYSTARGESEEILDHYGAESGGYAALVRAMTEARLEGGYDMVTTASSPFAFYSTDGVSSGEGALVNIWDGLYGDTVSSGDVAQAGGGSIWAGLASGSIWDGLPTAAPTQGSIWGGLPTASPTPGSIWAGLPTPGPAQAATPALVNIWAGLLNDGADYYQPGEANDNVQPGISEALAPDTLVSAAEAYFSSSALTAQSVYTLQLTRRDLDHLTAASGVLFLRRDGARICLGDLGETQIDWSTGLVFSMFDGSWPMLEGRMVRAQRLYAAEDGSARFVIPARVNGQRMYLLAAVDAGGEARILGATQGYDQAGFAVRGSIPLTPGMTVEPLYATVAPDGAETEYAGEAIEVPEAGLTLAWGPVPAGEYEYCFRLTDLAGRAQYTDAIALRF